MAVTAVTITSGPTVVGRSVTISGTLDRDGGGTLNTLNFLSYTVGYVSLGTLTRLSDNAVTYNASGTAGSGIAWTWTGVLPEGDYLGVSISLNDSPYTTLATSSNVGLIQLRKPLAGVWTPRRDASGLFVEATRSSRYPTIGVVGSPLRHYNYAAAGSNGIYTSVHKRIIRKTEESYGPTNLKSVYTPYGAGIDAQTGWQFGFYPTQGGGWNVPRQTWVSLFYIYDASKYVAGYPRFFGNIANLPTQRLQTICWVNTAGEQALLVSSDVSFSGGEVAVNGVGNGLHCMVVTSVASTAAGSVRVFLDGQLVATTTGPSGWNGGTYPTTDFYAGSVSQSGSNIGNILFNGILYGYVATDSEAAELSVDPYRYFFRDATPISSRAVRNLSFSSATYQYSRPIADISNTGWVRVP